MSYVQARKAWLEDILDNVLTPEVEDRIRAVMLKYLGRSGEDKQHIEKTVKSEMEKVVGDAGDAMSHLEVIVMARPDYVWNGKTYEYKITSIWANICIVDGDTFVSVCREFEVELPT